MVFVVLMLFVPTGFEFLDKALVELGVVQETQLDNEQPVIKRLNNPNAFNREYHIKVNGDLYSFYNLANMESKIREVHDNFGIQLYFIEYAMDFTDLRSSSSVVLKEVKEWITEEINDPYGLYYILAEYVIDYDSPAYDENIHYWDTEVEGQVVFGSEVDAWWNTEVQRAFEYSALAYDYTLNSYNAYDDFVYSISDMIIPGCESTEEEEEPNPFGHLVVFFLFSVVPILLTVMTIVKDIKAHKAKQAEQKSNEIKDILSTPIKTLEEEYAEELKDKYK